MPRDPRAPAPADRGPGRSPAAGRARDLAPPDLTDDDRADLLAWVGAEHAAGNLRFVTPGPPSPARRPR